MKNSLVLFFFFVHAWTVPNEIYWTTNTNNNKKCFCEEIYRAIQQIEDKVMTRVNETRKEMNQTNQQLMIIKANLSRQITFVQGQEDLHARQFNDFNKTLMELSAITKKLISTIEIIMGKVNPY